MSEDVRSTLQKRDDKGVVRHGGEWLAIWADPASLKSDAEKREESARDQALRDIEASLAAAARSLSGHDVDVVFGTSQADDANTIALPKLAPDASNLQPLRGRCDASASFLAHHDPKLHLNQTPEAPLEARLFLLLERIRCEALEARTYPGVERNLVALHYDRLDAAQLLHAHLASLVPLSEALRMVGRDTFLGRSDPSIQTAGFRMWDRWLRDRFQPKLAAMADALDDQRAFGNASLAFLEALLAELPSAGERKRREATRPSDDDGADPARLREADDPAEAPIFEPGELETDVADPVSKTRSAASAKPTAGGSCLHRRGSGSRRPRRRPRERGRGPCAGWAATRRRRSGSTSSSRA